MARNAAEEAADNAAVVARLRAALANPAFSDLVVRSESDGSETHATGFLLASCSPVFAAMLTGNFSEGVGDRARKRTRLNSSHSPSPAHTVHSSFSGDAMTAIVSFAATNDAPVLCSGSVEVLGELLEAAKYYDIGGLGAKAKTQLITRASEVPQEACRVLEAVWIKQSMDEDGDCLAQQVALAAMEAIEESADVALQNCECLCADAMRQVLSSPDVELDEDSMFLALQRWFEGPASVDHDDRKATAKSLVACLSLENMSPTFLKDVVAKSDLISKDALFEIFQEISIRSEAGGSFKAVFRPDSLLPNWCGTDSVEFANIDREKVMGLLSRSLSEGCWTWDVLVKKLSGGTFCVGVAGCPRNADYFGIGDSFYSYECGGLCASMAPGERQMTLGNVGMVPPSFTEGDSVRFFLDCDAKSLSISVNGDSACCCFKDMELPVDMVFKPALWFKRDCRVRLLRFKRERKVRNLIF